MRTILFLIVTLTSSAILIGCDAFARSDLAEPRWRTTASYDKIVAHPAGVSPIKPRPWPVSVAEYAPPVVTHVAHYFPDRFVTDGDGNDSYGWTWRDYVAAVYSPASFLVNAVIIPVRMIQDPPGVLITTDLDEPLATSAPLVPKD